MTDDKDKSRRASSTSLLTESLRDFSGYTTLHGLHFVFGTYIGTLRRLIWVILILTGLGFCTRQLIVSHDKLKAHDHVISKDIIPSEKLTFPAVSFCNVNMMKKSEIQGTDAQLYLDELNVLKRMVQRIKSVNKTLSSDFDIEKAVRYSGHSARSMVQACSWDGGFCSHLNFSTFLSQMYGLCHTFNSGKSGHPLLTSTSIKKSRGLVLLIDIDYFDYYGIGSYFNTGIQLVIHDQNEAPMVENNGLDVMPGLTNLKIKRSEFQNLPLPFRSACGNRPLETSNVYTRSVCLQECQTRKIIKQCGCKLLGMPALKEFNGTKYCSPESMLSCGLFPNESGFWDLGKLEDKMTKLYVELGDPFSSDNPDSDCNCPKPCREVEYQIVQLNSVALLSRSFWKDFGEVLMSLNNFKTEKEMQDWTSGRKIEIRENYLALVIHYEELHIHRTTERKAYDMNDFGSDVGGYIGLFLGCSILTVFEILDFILSICFTARNRTKSVGNVTEKPDADVVDVKL